VFLVAFFFWGSLPLKKNEVVFLLQFFLGRLPFSKILRLSSHIYSSWVRMGTRLPGSGLKCNHIRCGGVVVGFLPIIIPHQPSCFVLFCVVGWVVAIIKARSTRKRMLMPSSLMEFLPSFPFPHLDDLCNTSTHWGAQPSYNCNLQPEYGNFSQKVFETTWCPPQWLSRVTIF
jgi:hypothetical protein